MGEQDINGDGTDDVAEGESDDFGLFDISDAGVLTFKESPNFEGEGDDNYQVVVQASDGATMGTLSWFKVTVTVTDEEEEGSLTLRPMEQSTTMLRQPQVGVPITAADLMDPDGASNNRQTAVITTATYKWYRTSSRTSMGTEIDDATPAMYTPKDEAGNSDVGSYLRVVATYTDGRGSNKTATAVSEYETIALDLQQLNPRVRCANHHEGGAGGNARGHGHREPGHGHGPRQRRDIDLPAERRR